MTFKWKCRHRWKSVQYFSISRPDENEGWIDWMFRSPPRGVLVQIWSGYRPSNISPDDESYAHSGRIFICYKEDLSPESNANGLYWRLTGIGSMQLHGGNS